MVLQAPEVVQLAAPGERLRFATWESVGQVVLIIPEPRSPTIAITVAGAHTLRANYEKQYFVSASAPFGTVQRGWMNQGDELVLQVPPIEEIVPGESRLVFKKWEGQDGLTSPKVSGVLNSPVTLSALYESQYMVTVDAPYGAAGGGWQSAGDLVTITVPKEIESKFLFKKSFQGFAGNDSNEPSIDVLVEGPTIVTALYGNRVNFGLLALLLVLPLAAVIIFFGNRWVLLVVRRRGARPVD